MAGLKTSKQKNLSMGRMNVHNKYIPASKLHLVTWGMKPVKNCMGERKIQGEEAMVRLFSLCFFSSFDVRVGIRKREKLSKNRIIFLFSFS